MLLTRICPSAPLGAAALALLFGILPSSLARTSEPAESVLSVDAYYRPDEERGSFEMKMKPYPIPVKTTTYVSFAFNLPEDLPGMFHMVLGEVLKSKYPQHLHHFVLSGCTDKIDADLEGMPLTKDNEDGVGMNCITPMGGWAPGAALFGNVDNDTGILWGRGLGIQAVLMNVHYTDGAYEDPASSTHKMAEDGIRVHYTPDFRPYTTVPKSLINVGTGARKMVIPPGEPRFYITRTCKVGTSCKDISPEALEGILPRLGINAAGRGDVSCASATPFCGISWIQRFCPATCGFCAATLAEGEPNPLNPDGYRITGINYHAHLLGREMYATLLHEEGAVVADDGADPATAVLKNAPVPTAEDLQSKPIWIYDLQTTTPLEGEVVQDDAVLQGARVQPGDRIQVTCVYDSTAREEPTRFHISTYDEMCITTVHVTFATPASLSGEEGADAEGFQLDPAMELSLLSFDCDEDDETDIHVGTLAAGEDARDIWLNHPIADAEGCTFPHTGLGPAQREVRCPDGEGLICPGQKLLSDEIAGSQCTGGTLDGKDSNDGTTEAACVEGGGVYTPYKCQGVENWLNHDAEDNGLSASDVAFLAEFTYRPKCCAAAAGSSFICDDLALLADVNAGHSCTGGSLDQKDSNDGTTEAACAGGGGVYAPYTCAEADRFLAAEAGAFGINNEVASWVARSWYRSKCCGAAEKTPLEIEAPMDSERESESSSEQGPEGALGADVKTEQTEPGAESTAPILMLRPVLAMLLCVAATAPAILL